MEQGSTPTADGTTLFSDETRFDPIWYYSRVWALYPSGGDAAW